MPVNPFSLRVTSHVETEQRKIVVELAQSAETAIVATGAEVALVPECVVAMRKSGVIIHIKRNKEIIMKDIENSQGGLFLENMSTGKKINMRGWAVELYAKEQASYEALADITVINDGTVDDGAEKLYRSIHNCMSDTACDQGAKPFPQGEAKGPSGEGP
jgi:shikimate kinase